MNTKQIMADKVAVSLSFLCTIHCLATPLLVTFLPSIIGLRLQDEAFHFWLVIAVIPLSLYALTMGCKNHKRLHVLLFGVIGLLILGATVMLGHDVLGEAWEKILTVLGSGFVALGHVWNYRLCQSHDKCMHPEHQ